MAIKHGMMSSSAYGSWQNMRARCHNLNCPTFKHYGGRGITICRRWNDFAAFAADMGPRPPGASLDRIDVNKGYRPGNCRWATPKAQSLNTRRNVRWAHNGETLTMSEWAERLDVAVSTLRMRVKRDGWTVEQALTIRPDQQRRIGRRTWGNHTHAG